MTRPIERSCCIVRFLIPGARWSGFLSLLDELVEHRNYIAHEILAQDAILRSMIGDAASHLSEKLLRHALYCVEQTILFHDEYLPKLKAADKNKA